MSIAFQPLVAEDQKFFVGNDEAVSFAYYEEFVCNLIKERGTPEANKEHMLIGIGGEAGEIMDCVKKETIYGKEIDMENLVEELGDLEFYMAGLRQMYCISRESTLRANITKLGKRYKHGYSDAAAQARADKTDADPTNPVTPGIPS